MGRNAVGFYWTLPVPWAGFTRLPEEIDEAAKVSRTIRYQLEAIRRFAKDEAYHLIHEEVFIEIEPDRGSEFILEPLRRVEKTCRMSNAALLFVDFSEVQSWRSHMALKNWLRRAQIETIPLFPAELLIDGHTFDPQMHFRTWREKQSRWAMSKPERAANALSLARALRGQGVSYQKIADTLNAENLRNLSGKLWTADNIRKFLINSHL